MTKQKYKIGKRLGNLQDIPDELKRELNTFQKSEEDSKIIEVIRTFEGIANIDEVLVGFYRKFGEIKKRKDIALKLYRLSRAGILLTVPKKKGVYEIVIK